MREYKNLIIGFGKAGKTLAGYLAKQGEKTALVEENPLRYGGTCINVACIPSKSLEHSAALSATFGGSLEEKKERYRAAIAEKQRLTGFLRQKNYEKIASTGAEIIDARAVFLDQHHVKLQFPDGRVDEAKAERIFINTGAVTVIPPIAGIENNPKVFTSESMMELSELPEKLVIIGGGYIGLEFASYYNNFGSEVTVIQDSEQFIPREDKEMAALIEKTLVECGIEIIKGAKVEEIQGGSVRFTVGGKAEEKTGDAVLLATGRKPNSANLGLEHAGVEVTARGGIVTDAQCRTKVPHIFAMGDVRGELQFTYISLDDFRIVRDALKGKGRSTENRGAVPYAVFLTPPFARVGLSEEEAVAAGKKFKKTLLPTAAIPKAQVLRETRGALKVLVEEGTGLILGAHLFCPESPEMINLVKRAMDSKIPASELAEQIYTHPTMTEAFNDLFA